MDSSFKELSPIMDVVSFLGQSVGLPVGDDAINVSIHEDNAGALVLAETLSPQFIPRSKHYATKTVWFCEEVLKRGIKIVNIDALPQLGDLLRGDRIRQSSNTSKRD